MIDAKTKRSFHKVVSTRVYPWWERQYWNALERLSIALDFYIRTHKPVETSRGRVIQPTGLMLYQWDDSGELFRRGTLKEIEVR